MPACARGPAARDESPPLGAPESGQGIDARGAAGGDVGGGDGRGQQQGNRCRRAMPDQSAETRTVIAGSRATAAPVRRVRRRCRAPREQRTLNNQPDHVARGLRPSAIRTPISGMRCATENDTTLRCEERSDRARARRTPRAATPARADRHRCAPRVRQAPERATRSPDRPRRSAPSRRRSRSASAAAPRAPPAWRRPAGTAQRDVDLRRITLSACRRARVADDADDRHVLHLRNALGAHPLASGSSPGKNVRERLVDDDRDRRPERSAGRKRGRERRNAHRRRSTRRHRRGVRRRLRARRERTVGQRDVRRPAGPV